MRPTDYHGLELRPGLSGPVCAVYLEPPDPNLFPVWRLLNAKLDPSIIHPLPVSTGDPDRAGVIHDVASIGHVQADRDKQQQNRGGDEGEQNAIHDRQTMGPDIVPYAHTTTR